MNVKKIGLFALFAAGVVNQAVFAETKFDDEPQIARDAVKETVSSTQERVSVKTELSPGVVSEKGTPKGSPVVIKGFGKDVSILMALKQVTPSGWQAKKDGQVDVSKTLSWKGGRPWTEIMSDIAAAGNVNLLINWDEKILVVSQSKKPVFESKVSEVQKKAMPKRWELVSGKTLRENIEAWAAQTSSPKWSVAWYAANYQIKFPAAFVGEFDDDQNGPIAAVMEAYRNHDIPLRAEFQDDNHVLKIMNANFSQQQDRLNKLEEPWNGRGN